MHLTPPGTARSARFTLTNTVGSVTHALGFAFSLQTSGDFGEIMSLDANNFVAAGTMQLAKFRRVHPFRNGGELRWNRQRKDFV